MPKEGISIYFTIQDGASQVLATIGDKTKALDKETQQLAQSQAALQKSNEPLIQKQQELRVRLEEVSRTLSDARSAWKQYDSAIAKEAMEEAIQEQDELKRALRETEDQIKSNTKAHNEMRESIRKGAMSEGTGGGSGNETSLTSLAKGLMAGQVGQLFSSSLGGAAEAYLTSAMGLPQAALVSDTISSAISGAAAGAALGPMGVAAGGVAGAFSGLVSGWTQIEQAKDEAFKSYVQEQAEGALSEQDSMISSGSAIAGSREQTQMAFAQRLGSEAAASAYLDQVKTMAAKTNYSYDEITGYSKLLLNSYQADETLGILQTLSDATAGLNLSSSDVNMMISGLSRMRTTGKATQEYLNYFRERGVDVDQALAGELGVDKSKISDMVSKGQIGGADAAQAILDFIDQEFGGLSDRLAETYDAMVDNLADAEANLEARAGEGYNEERKKGIEAQQNWLEENETALGDAYSAIGAWKAKLENSKEEFIRTAMDNMMETDEYKAAEAAGDAAEMGRMLMEAKVKGMNEYNASDGAQLALESERALAGAIRDDASTNQDYWDAGYEKSQWFSKGLAAGLGAFDISNPDDMERLGTGLSASQDDIWNQLNGYAYGLERVPYDGYAALLHEGERVLTAQEARAQDSGGAQAPIQITITGNRFTGGGEEMAEELAEVLARKLEQAATAAVPR